MEKTRRLKTFSIVALIVAVLGLTIAFAALSKTLTINGTGSVDAANWDIHFKNISEAILTGKATTTGTPSLADNGATINDMKVSLKEPGDKVVYTVDIENSGDINAEIDSIVLPTLTTAQSNILDFKAVYTSNNKEIASGDILQSKETKNVTITIMYKDITDESLLPKEGININLNYELHFVQTDKASGSSSQGGNNPSSSYGVAIASKQLSDTITATYYGGEEQQDGTYQGGTLVISGTGDMPSNEDFKIQMFLANVSTVEELEGIYDEETNTMNFKYNPISLVIEEGVTAIGESSFDSILTITNVTLPSTLKSIGEAAFHWVPLNSINFNEGLEIIDSSALENTHLTEVVFPASLKEIRSSAFYETPLEKVYIGSGVTKIGRHAFERIATNSVIYCETEAVRDLLSDEERYETSRTQVIVDPTKFN